MQARAIRSSVGKGAFPGRALASRLLLSLLAGSAAAQVWPVEDGGMLSVQVGRGVLVNLPGDVERVALADDSIARPQVISAQEVLITGLVPGITTVYAWLVDGGRLKYDLRVDQDLSLLVRALRDLDLRIEVETSADGGAILLRGEVDDRRTAREAQARVRGLLEDQKIRLLNVIRYPGYGDTDADRQEQRLRQALEDIDPRIGVRRIQVNDDPDPATDSFLLEGRVRDVRSLVEALTVAERQLGGSGSEVHASNDQRLRYQRFRGFTGNVGGGGGNSSVLQGTTPSPGGLASQVSRGLVLTSQSGRVLSLLEVDDLPQVLVSIRVVEVDRTKAKKVGINWRWDNEHVSLGSILSPQINTLPALGAVSNQTARTPRRSVVRDGPNSTGDFGTNLFGAYIDKVTSVVAAIDFLEDKALARSVAEPNILTLSGESATVVVGGEVPIPTNVVNQVASVQGFFFQDFGVRLDIRPTVVKDGIIALEASPSIIRRSVSIGVGDVPGFSVQSVQTTARVQTGESLVLGGLLTFEEGLEERSIPGLGWLPGLGRWRRKSRNETELLFVISPRIVETPRSDEPAEPIEMPDLEEVAPPELDWPEDRDGWRDEFEPQEARPDGVPASFIPEVEETEAVEDDLWGNLDAEAPPEEAPESEPPPGGEAQTLEEEDASTLELEWDEPVVEPEPGPEILVVDADPCLNLRPLPGTSEGAVDCLAAGTEVEILGEDGGWKSVMLPTGQTGWVAANYLVPISPDLDRLTAERDALMRQVEAAESADEDLEEQLRRIQEDIGRIRASQQERED